MADRCISPEQTNQPLKAQISNLDSAFGSNIKVSSPNKKEIKLAATMFKYGGFIAKCSRKFCLVSSATIRVWVAVCQVEGSRKQETSILLGPLVFSKSLRSNKDCLELLTIQGCDWIFSYQEARSTCILFGIRSPCTRNR